MKRIILVSACFMMLAANVMAQKPAAPKPKTSASEDTIQYALGVYMMQQLLAKTGFIVTNPTMFKKAIDDVAANKKLMVDPASTEERLLAYQRLFQQEKGKKLQELLFAKVKTTPGFSALPSGVYYSLSKMGTGVIPTAKDTVIMNVTTSLPDGTIIEDASKTKQSYMALAGDMIAGLRDVVLRMPEGTVCRAIVPYTLAYGEAGTATIPPNSAVIYDVALVTVRKAK